MRVTRSRSTPAFATANSPGGIRSSHSPACPEAAGEVAADYDDRKFTFAGSLRGVSAKEEKIPDLPIVVVAEE